MRLRALTPSDAPPALHAHLRAIAEAGPVPSSSEDPGSDVRTRDPSPEVHDVVLASTWRSCAEAFALDARRYVRYLDRLEHRELAPEDPDRIAAAIALDLPFDFVVETEALAAFLRDVRPEARVEVVRPGRPELCAVGPEDDGGALRVALAGNAAMGAEVLGAMGEAHEVVDGFGGSGSPGALREPASAADVVVALAETGPALHDALRAFAAGATVLASPHAGHDELVRHGENGLVADPGDVRGAARALDLLARDRERLRALRAAATATASAWPGEGQAAGELRAALERFLADEPPAAARWPARLMGDAIAQAASVRGATDALLEGLRAAEADASAARAELGALRAGLQHERAYQAAVKLRTLVRKFR